MLNPHQAAPRLINLQKVKAENLKFRTDLRDLNVDGWSVKQQVIDYKGRLLKNQMILKLKIEACPLNAGHYMAFKYSISFVSNLVAIESESCQKLFPSLYAPPSEVAVLFNSNLSRRPILGQVVNLDLLLCTGFY